MSPLKTLCKRSFCKNLFLIYVRCDEIWNDLIIWQQTTEVSKRNKNSFFHFSKCSSFKVSASKVEPTMEQLTNQLWIWIVHFLTMPIPILFYFLEHMMHSTKCITFNTYSFVHSALQEKLETSCRTLQRLTTEVWLKNCKKKKSYPLFHERVLSAPSCTMPGIVTALPGLLNIATSEC